ncbi:transmembrane protease serine 9-like [Spodoptera litura]|uniref:Transmembrane protease serine 9-like n=1 Tax=Spodoptera litura TaxID=69820 RepID=A0A9J7EBZ5_SPOLT|nr:transmembrane protease serine 9-like [Spodoptera litura]
MDVRLFVILVFSFIVSSFGQTTSTLKSSKLPTGENVAVNEASQNANQQPIPPLLSALKLDKPQLQSSKLTGSPSTVTTSPILSSLSDRSSVSSATTSSPPRLIATPTTPPNSQKFPISHTTTPSPPVTPARHIAPIPNQYSFLSAPAHRVHPYDPCAPYVPPPKPDFRAPGRRVSEMKCFEYIWQLKMRSDKAGQENECYEMRSRGMSYYVVGGHYTFTGDYPNMGAIGWKEVIGTWKFMCGCTLISSRFVLTAAHCSKASSRDTTIEDVIPKIVRLGDKNIQDTVDDRYDATIIEIINHPKYTAPKQYFDIAVMKLGEVIEFNMNIQPACLWTKDSITRYGDQAQVTGWGVIESGTLRTSPELQAATVDIIDFHQCNKLLKRSCNRNWCGLQPDQLCAGKMGGGVDACQGDSGGPLQVKIPLPILNQGTMHYVVGVTSFGVGCALPGLPGVYTKVAKFADWIESVVWPEVNATISFNDLKDGLTTPMSPVTPKSSTEIPPTTPIPPTKPVPLATVPTTTTISPIIRFRD